MVIQLEKTELWLAKKTNLLQKREDPTGEYIIKKGIYGLNALCTGGIFTRDITI